MAKFKKGDVCIVIKSVNVPEMIGEEVVLTSDAKVSCDIINNEYYIGYNTGIPVTVGSVAGFFGPREDCLKLKPYKGEESVMQMFTTTPLILESV